MEKTVDRLLGDSVDEDLFQEPEGVIPDEDTLRLIEVVRTAKKGSPGQEKARKELRQREFRAFLALRAWWLQRMRYSPQALREMMTLFWHGHFATSAEKVRSPLMLYRQNQTLRDGALGGIPDLAQAIASDPAMMRYLDVTGSTRAKPNENFARELMELFLLGEGHYTEEDIRECARAFTGYRVNPATGEVRFFPRQHDSGTKTIFGKSGEFGAADVVEIIASQPRCADFLGAKIWAFLAGRPASPELVRALGQSLRSGELEVAPFLRTILSSREFYEDTVIGQSVKSPVVWLVGTSKALGLPLHGSMPEQNALRELGQVLFAPPNVKGWEGGLAWISATTLVNRCNLADTLFLRNARGREWIAPRERSSPRQAAEAAMQILFPIGGPPGLVERAASEGGPQDRPVTDEGLIAIFRTLLTAPEFQLT
ncbi:MAG: hypothetical protein Fur0032_07030 [Terrimicrobiaceae bacterium]